MVRLKRIQKIIIGAAALLTALGITAGVAAAARNENVSGVSDHTLYKFGQNVTINGTINGDIYCAGQTVDIDATVNGDVLCAGQNITVNGQVNGNIRVAGQTVHIGAKVQRSASVAGQDVTTQPSSAIATDLSLAAESGHVDGNIGRDLHGSVQDLTLNNLIGRDAEIQVDKLNLTGRTNIGRNLIYTAPKNRLTQASGAVIAGKVTYKTLERNHHNRNHLGWLRGIYLLIKIVTGLVLVALLPQLFRRWTDYTATRWGWALLIGFLSMFVWPIMVVALFATVIGIPLAIFAGALWLVALFPAAVVGLKAGV